MACCCVTPSCAWSTARYCTSTCVLKLILAPVICASVAFSCALRTLGSMSVLPENCQFSDKLYCELTVPDGCVNVDDNTVCEPGPLYPMLPFTLSAGSRLANAFRTPHAAGA